MGKPATLEAHPGIINSADQIEKIQVENEPRLTHKDDTVQLRLSCKEDQDFVLLPKAVYMPLYELYGGTSIPRQSIEAACDEDSTDKSYIVEVYYQKLQFYILPKTSNHLVLKKPSGVFISRKATVFDFHQKIAEIFYANT